MKKEEDISGIKYKPFGIAMYGYLAFVISSHGTDNQSATVGVGPAETTEKDIWTVCGR